MLSGVCRVGISIVVIMFELTGGLTYVSVFMVSCFLAKMVGDALTKGIYDEHIRLRGYPYLDNHSSDHGVEGSRSVTEIMETNLAVINVDSDKHTIDSLFQFMGRTPMSSYPLVTGKDWKLVGSMRLLQLRFHLETAQLDVPGDTQVVFQDLAMNAEMSEARLRRLARKDMAPMVTLGYSSEDMAGMVLVIPETPLSQVHSLFKIGSRVVFIVKSGSLVGVLTKKKYLAYAHVQESKERSQQSFFRRKHRAASDTDPDGDDDPSHSVSPRARGRSASPTPMFPDAAHMNRM